MSDLSVFAFDTRAVRVVMVDGEPWFVGKDVAEVLGYANPADAITKHCKGVAKRYPLSTPGGTQELRIISEPDMLRLIVNSTLPAAEKFERWVFEDVLPSIRKTGSYAAALNPANFSRLQLIEMAMQAEQERIELEGKVQALIPKAEVHDRIADAEGSITLRETASNLKVPERKFIAWMESIDWVYRRVGHKSLLAKAEPRKAGYLMHKITPIRDIHTGEERLNEQVRVTPLGLTVLAKKIQKSGLIAQEQAIKEAA